MFRKIPDNFFLGMAAGAALLFFLAALIQVARHRLYTEAALPRYWQEPVPELFVLLVNVFLFRFLMLNVKKEQAGKGVLFVTMIVVMIYYFGRLKHPG